MAGSKVEVCTTLEAHPCLHTSLCTRLSEEVTKCKVGRVEEIPGSSADFKDKQGPTGNLALHLPLTLKSW